MSDLRTTIQSKMKDAMKNKDQISLLVYRNLISDFKKWEVDNIKTLTDEIALKIIHSNLKTRDQSIESFKNAGRTDLLEKEEKERKVLEEFLPKQISQAQAKTIIEDIIKTLSQDDKQIGNVMKLVMSKLQGQIDNKIISTLVKECLKN